MFPIPQTQVSLLVEIGMSASLAACPEQAIQILQGVDRAMESNANARTALAIAYLNNAQLPQAIELFESVLGHDPEHRICRCFFGLALRIAGREHDARSILEPLVSASEDSDSQRFATLIASTNRDQLPQLA